jgi:hypothetical protein
MVQVAVTGSVAEAEELRTILRNAGIESELESAVVHDPRGTEDVPTRVLVPEAELDTAQDAILAFTEPDELVSDA